MERRSGDGAGSAGRPRCIGASADRRPRRRGPAGDPHGRSTSAAAKLLDEALAQARPTGELQRLAPVAAARAEAAWLRRDVAAIDAETTDAAELAAARQQPWELGELATWRARAGLPFPAGDLAPPFAAELAGDPARAARLWDDSAAPTNGVTGVQAGDEPRLREALGQLQRLGALPAARLVARRLRELGVRDIRAVHIQLPRAIRGR